MVDRASFSLFTGCLIRARLPHLEKSARAVFETLGVQLSDLEGASCCPDPVGIRGWDEETWLVMAARNLALAGNHDQPLMTLCSGCYSTLLEAQHLLANDATTAAKVNQVLGQIGRPYVVGPPVEHFARYLVEKAGREDWPARMVGSWQGLPVAVHHGCHFLRPSHIIEFDDPENPTKLEELVRALGAEVVDYPRKMLCCGFSIQGIDPDLALRMAREKLLLMKEYGARAVIVLCPSCYLQFDLMQQSIEREFGEPVELPVFYLTEFVGLALGLTASTLGLSFHRVDALPLVRAIFRDGAAET